MGDSRTILLVEDDGDFREAIRQVLHRSGYTVLPAADATEAESRLATGLPDLLLVDMLLPVRSGFQVLRLVKEQSDGRVPAIMVSGLTSPIHQQYAHAAGADRFLVKPFRLAQLLDTLESLCPLPRPATRPHAPTVAACS